MQVHRAMVPKEKLITATSDTNVLDAMKLMVSNNVGSIIISENNVDAKGIVTSEDLMKAVIENTESGQGTLQ